MCASLSRALMRVQPVMRRCLLLAATLASVVGCAPAGCQSAAGIALYGEIAKKHTAVIERATAGVQRGYPSFAVSELARWEGDLKKYKERVASDSQLNMADRWSLEQAIGALEDQTRSLQKVYQELGTGLAVP